MTKCCKLSIGFNSAFYFPEKMDWLKKLTDCDQKSRSVKFSIEFYQSSQSQMISFIRTLLCSVDKIIQWCFMMENGWLWAFSEGLSLSLPSCSENENGLEKFSVGAWSIWWPEVGLNRAELHNEWYNCYFADSLKNSISAAVTCCCWLWPTRFLSRPQNPLNDIL